ACRYASPSASEPSLRARFRRSIAPRLRAITRQSPTCSATSLGRCPASSASSFASSGGCVSPRNVPPPSATTSVSGPRPLRRGPTIAAARGKSRASSRQSCAERARTRRKKALDAGATEAPPESPEVAVFPPQPASASTSAAAAAATRALRTPTMLLVARAASHQRGDELAEALTLEDAADALGDRQLDPEPAGEVAQHRRGRQPLDHLSDLGDRLRRRRALGDQLAGVPVAAVPAVAGDDQVAH